MMNLLFSIEIESYPMYLYQVSNVHGHLVNLCVVKLLNILVERERLEVRFKYVRSKYLPGALSCPRQSRS